MRPRWEAVTSSRVRRWRPRGSWRTSMAAHHTRFVYIPVHRMASGDVTEQVGSEPPLPAEARGEAPGRARLIDTSLGRLASKISPARERVKIPAGRQGTAWEVAYGA